VHAVSEVAELYIDCHNQLGEGPVWHGEREELLWFDLFDGIMHRAKGQTIIASHEFGEAASAAAIVDRDRVAVATASGLFMLDLESGERELIIDIDADTPTTRSNDARVNMAGGFWIGTMGKKAEEGAGRIYQYRAGKLDRIFSTITIPNSICFTADGKTGYFTDSPKRKIMKTAMDSRTGLPMGTPQLFFDLGNVAAVPDGSVVDSQGYLWNARWDGYCVVRHAPDGTIDRVIDVPTAHVTCPCFGGPDLKTLFLTSARQGLNAEELAAQPNAGAVFAIRVDVPGRPEVPLVV
jgi:sugar lactone lactonase YvrE